MTGGDAGPAVFVVGCPRSGTTLLQRMLDHHPDLAVANDTHFIPRFVPPAGPDAPLMPGRLAELTASRRFARFGLPASAVRRAAGRGSYRAFVAALYAEFAAARGKAHAGDKTPDYVRHLPLLHDLFPAARFVHLVRDGRDVALSVREWATASKGPGRLGLWDTEPVATCALWWQRFVREGRRDGRCLPGDRYLEVRYEDLVTGPEPTMARILAFIGLVWSDAVVNFQRGRRHDAPRQSAERASMPPTRGLRDWRRDLDGRSCRLFEALAGDTLTEFGYPLSGVPPAPEVVATARRCRAWWEVDRRRDHAAPPAWVGAARTP